jgi:hypothetical protein
VDDTYVLYGVLAVLFVGGASAVRLVLWYAKRSDDHRKQRAQQNAIVAHSTLNALLLELGARPYPPPRKRTYNAVATAYADFHMSGHGDPTIDGQTVYAYDAMRRRYKTMTQELTALQSPGVRHAKHSGSKASRVAHCRQPRCRNTVLCPGCQRCADHCQRRTGCATKRTSHGTPTSHMAVSQHATTGIDGGGSAQPQKER